jgi:hypothetical protein
MRKDIDSRKLENLILTGWFLKIQEAFTCDWALNWHSEKSYITYEEAEGSPWCHEPALSLTGKAFLIAELKKKNISVRNIWARFDEKNKNKLVFISFVLTNNKEYIIDEDSLGYVSVVRLK